MPGGGPGCSDWAMAAAGNSAATMQRPIDPRRGFAITWRSSRTNGAYYGRKLRRAGKRVSDTSFFRSRASTVDESEERRELADCIRRMQQQSGRCEHDQPSRRPAARVRPGPAPSRGREAQRTCRQVHGEYRDEGQRTPQALPRGVRAPRGFRGVVRANQQHAQTGHGDGARASEPRPRPSEAAGNEMQRRGYGHGGDEDRRVERRGADEDSDESLHREIGRDEYHRAPTPTIQPRPDDQPCRDNAEDHAASPWRGRRRYA